MSMLLTSFVAGILTVLTPCVLPVLPVVLGVSTSKKSVSRVFLIVSSLAFSIIVFSLLLKVSTLFLEIDEKVWQGFSGLVFLTFGIFTLFPQIWEKIALVIKTDPKKIEKLASGSEWYSPILLGLALGPIFNTCSPTYLIILANIVNSNFVESLVHLFVYTFSFSVVLFIIGILGQNLAIKMKFLSNPNGWFKKAVAILFIILGLLIFTGYDKKVETWLTEKGFGEFSVEKEIDLLKE